MTHWHTQDSLSREHRADLDREAAREGRIAEAKAATATRPTPTPSAPTIADHVRSWAKARVAWVVSRDGGR